MGQVVRGQGCRVSMGPRDGIQPFFGMRQGQIAEAFGGKFLDDGVEHPMGGIRHITGNVSHFQRALEPSQFIAMQEIVRRGRGAQYGVRTHLG